MLKDQKTQKQNKQTMTLMTLDQCLAFNSDFKTIRVHKATQQASEIRRIQKTETQENSENRVYTT